jgi:hypothetical protein
MMFVPHRKRTYSPVRSVMEIALLFHMYMMFVLQRKHTYRPPRPVTGLVLLVCMYVYAVRTSQETLIDHGQLLPPGIEPRQSSW